MAEVKDRKTIAEQLASFKKPLWANDRPMDFATDVVEEMLLEIQRQQTVMRASADELRRQWKAHLSDESITEAQLQNLLFSLSGARRGFYAQYLSPSEYHEFVLRQSSFETIAMMEEGNEEKENNNTVEGTSED